MAKGNQIFHERLAILATLLKWEGELKNSRIQKLLGLTSVRASRLIAEFRETFPDRLELDTQNKRWVPRQQVANHGVPDFDNYLEQVKFREESVGEWLEDTRATFLTPHPETVAILRKACIEGLGLEINYRSMRHPDGQERVIYPHTVVRMNRRWHVRSWCGLREDYRDFNVGRIRSIKMSTETRPSSLPEDSEWETKIDLRVGAHRHLDEGQARLVRDEYFEGAVARRLNVRAAIAGYVLQDLQVATLTEIETPPRYQLELLNVDEVNRHLFPEIKGGSSDKKL